MKLSGYEHCVDETFAQCFFVKSLALSKLTVYNQICQALTALFTKCETINNDILFFYNH